MRPRVWLVKKKPKLPTGSDVARSDTELRATSVEPEAAIRADRPVEFGTAGLQYVGPMPGPSTHVNLSGVLSDWARRCEGEERADKLNSARAHLEEVLDHSDSMTPGYLATAEPCYGTLLAELEEYDDASSWLQQALKRGPWPETTWLHQVLDGCDVHARRPPGDLAGNEAGRVKDERIGALIEMRGENDQYAARVQRKRDEIVIE